MTRRTIIQAQQQTPITNLLSRGKILQRKCESSGQNTRTGGECSECIKKQHLLQRRTKNHPESLEVPPIVDEVLQSPGQPLDSKTRTFMQSRFRQDFSQVRVHTDTKAIESVQAVNALAYTVGQDIVFGMGQYSPSTITGKKLLAHELTHVVQQGVRTDKPINLKLGDANDRYEGEADQIANQILTPQEEIKVQNITQNSDAIQRFSTSEHEEIGRRAYEEANPQNQSASGGKQVPSIDPAFVSRLKDFRYTQAGGKQLTYAQLIAAADNFASFELMEDKARQRAGAGTRIPLLSPIWDWIGDKTHYLDLAARNRQHFHPHNFMSWQAWHWTALRTMHEAWKVGEEANHLKIETRTLLQQFDGHQRQARAAIQEQEAPSTTESRSSELERIVNREIEQMQQILRQVQAKQQQAIVKREQANNMALQAMAINGFGDHFLTDAFAGGHIVTPRKELLDEYATYLLGFIKVGGVLQCSNIPSLAWHDLDNRFGVWVNNMEGDRWLTYGDDYANSDKLPLGKSQSDTLKYVVKATKESIQQMWQAAAGRMPGDLSPVLNKIPRPELSPGQYPNWQPNPVQAWNLQLRYAAGEQVGISHEGIQGSPGSSSTPKEEVPNPKGDQIGEGILSARVTCLNLLSTFSYDKFVVPMIERARRDYNERFYTGSKGQIAPPTATPTAQESAKGFVVAGSIIGGLLGAVLGALAGGLIGGIIGGAAGLLIGGFVGGLLGKPHEEKH